jgi:hypothetical protein
MRRVGNLRVVVPAAVAVVTLGLLVGCTSPSASTSKTPAAATKTTSAASPSSTPTSDVPTIDLTGTAAQNQAYFDLVNQKFIAAGGDLTGRPFIDNLVKAGFPKTNMELTPDRTTVNDAADNIQFSIRFGTTCLIGQYGNIGYSSTHTRTLGNDRCLVGTTRPIDW